MLQIFTLASYNKPASLVMQSEGQYMEAAKKRGKWSATRLGLVKNYKKITIHSEKVSCQSIEINSMDRNLTVIAIVRTSGWDLVSGFELCTSYRPIRLTKCCTQFKPFGNKTFCLRNFHII